MPWQDQLKGDSLTWLIHSDIANVRYLALRDLLDRPSGDPELREARSAAHRSGPIAAILAEMSPEGWWAKPGAGYSPKYRSTVWSLVTLAQLGARVEEDERIGLACAYLIKHALTAGGHFSYNGTPSGTIDCLQGNLSWALTTLGCQDNCLEQAYEWMARTVTGEGIAPQQDKTTDQRFYAYKCGPGFTCGANYRLPCAWGSVKVMLAFSQLNQAQRTPQIERAITAGAEFLLAVDPATAEYPRLGDKKPNLSWWKFGFPVFYITDVLQLAEALAGLGYGQDPRLAGLLEFIRKKQDEQGRWRLEYDYKGKTWQEYGVKRQPSPWVTIRALRVLKAAYK